MLDRTQGYEGRNGPMDVRRSGHVACLVKPGRQMADRVVGRGQFAVILEMAKVG